MKKKSMLCLVCLAWVAGAHAQFASNRPMTLVDPAGVQDVKIIIINGIDAATELQYTDGYETIAWYEYANGDTFVGNQSYISPDDNTGYRLEVDGKSSYVWVFDYRAYRPQIALVDPQETGDSPCDLLTFRLTPAMQYVQPGTDKRLTLKRSFTLRYPTRIYPDGGKDWVGEEAVLDVNFVGGAFHLEGDDLSLDPQVQFVFEETPAFVQDLGLTDKDRVTASCDFPLTVPVKSRLTALMTVRDALNELSRPSEGEPTPPVKASAPIEMLFESRVSDPNSTLYDWKLYKGSELLLTRTDEDLRYTFEAFGTYRVQLTVDNGLCSMIDSLEVSVAESFLGVPNVFTPNGDGTNDEFRVAYRSLASFHCWVYNSWGKLVYEWSDPAKGWDGRVNGKKNAPNGTYFYIIKATGTDGEVHNKKGDINIIR